MSRPIATRHCIRHAISIVRSYTHSGAGNDDAEAAAPLNSSGAVLLRPGPVLSNRASLEHAGRAAAVAAPTSSKQATRRAGVSSSLQTLGQCALPLLLR